MAHKWMICLLARFAHMAFVSCDNGRNADDRLPDINDFVEGEDHSVLVAYFSEPLPAERSAAACPDGAVTAGDWGWTDINFTGRTGYEKNWRLLSLSASRCA